MTDFGSICISLKLLILPDEAIQRVAQNLPSHMFNSLAQATNTPHYPQANTVSSLYVELSMKIFNSVSTSIAIHTLRTNSLLNDDSPYVTNTAIWANYANTAWTVFATWCAGFPRTTDLSRVTVHFWGFSACFNAARSNCSGSSLLVTRG